MDTQFWILAGVTHKWDLERDLLLGIGQAPSVIQANQYSNGKREAELMRTEAGWEVHSPNPLDNFTTLFTPDQSVADKGCAEAYAWGCAWANAEPHYRVFWIHERLIPQYPTETTILQGESDV